MSKRDRGNKGGLVYSTDHGEMCPSCDRPVADCNCRRSTAPPAAGGVIRVGRETKGRKGKGMTVVIGVPLAGDELAELGKHLKHRCGSGGTIKDGVIEIQGDHRDTVVAELERRGWRVKRSGG